MEKQNEVVLQNAKIENVMRYLYEKLRGISGKHIERKSDDGTIYMYLIQNPRSGPDKIDVSYTTTITPQGNVEKSYGFWQDLNAMRFECLQLQTGEANTVRVKGECNHDIVLSDFNRYWAGLLKDFGAIQPLPITDEIDYTDFDPPHYERIVRGTAEQITKFINDFIQRDGTDLQLKFAYHGQGYLFGKLKKQPSGQHSIFVSKYDVNEKRDPVGPVINFEFVEAADRVKVRGACYYDDTAVIEYFNTLWQKFTELFPAVEGTQQPQASEVKPQSNSIQQIAINTTSVIAGSEYDNLPLKELKNKAARFDAMRYGVADTQAAEIDSAKHEKQENNKAMGSVRDILENSQETIPLGLLLYKSAKDVVDMSPLGFMPVVNSLSPSQRASRIFMSYAGYLAMPKDDNGVSNRESFKEDFESGFFDFLLPIFAADFLRQFPTPSLAVAKFPRIIRFADFYSNDTLTTVDKVLNLSVEEADTLIRAKPLVMEFRDKLQSQSERQATAAKLKKPREKSGKRKSQVPTRPADRMKWAILWDFAETRVIAENLNARTLRLYLDNYNDHDKPDWIPQDNDTLQRIINEGKLGNIPRPNEA